MFFAPPLASLAASFIFDNTPLRMLSMGLSDGWAGAIGVDAGATAAGVGATSASAGGGAIDVGAGGGAIGVGGGASVGGDLFVAWNL